jgi:hypothetical protein
MNMNHERMTNERTNDRLIEPMNFSSIDFFLLIFSLGGDGGERGRWEMGREMGGWDGIGMIFFFSPPI